MTGRAAWLGLAVATLVMLLAVPGEQYLAQQRQISELQSQVAAAQGRVDTLTTQVAQWDDPAFIAAQARSRLRYVLPGEVAYTVIGAPVIGLGASSAAAGSNAAAVRAPWYSSLWISVQGIDHPAPAKPAASAAVTPAAVLPAR